MTLAPPSNTTSTSIGDRLRAARVAADLSTRALSERLGPKVGVSHATIANYERGLTRPSMPYLAAVAAELGRPLDWFLRSGHALRNVRYRKRKSLVTRTACSQYEFAAQNWLDAYLLVECAAGEPLRQTVTTDLKACRASDPIQSAKNVREALNLDEEAPIASVPEAMQRFGIRVLELASEEAIDGLAAVYQSEFVSVLTQGLPSDRFRLNAAHEFGHFVAGDVETDILPPTADVRAFEFGSHLLLPIRVLKRAIDRKSMVHLVEIKRKYGLSMAAMIYRAEKAGYLSSADAKRIWIEFAKRGWRQQEPGTVSPDRAVRFEILLERALSLGKLTIDDISRRTGLTGHEIKRRLADSIGFTDEAVDMVDRRSTPLKLAR